MSKLHTLFTALLLSAGAVSISHAEDDDNINNLSIEDLLNVEVTSVSKKAQSLNDAAAAIFVISQEDIKRSGATSIPEALRLAPGLDVARINANQWAISARGFNSRLAHNLQVLIDGRSVYNRAFAGVDWENQDVVLEDIDRIEVIRGPGATMWGANAVNGVINIITKTARETLGGLVTAGGGNFEQGFGSFRYGSQINAETSARAYVKGFNRGGNVIQPHITGYDIQNAPQADHWDKQQGGFRLDSKLNNRDELTFQGDVYSSSAALSSMIPDFNTLSDNVLTNATHTLGGNLLGRFQRTLSTTSEFKVQLYYDSYDRYMGIFKDARDTLDLDIQHRFLWLQNHEIIWGANYKYGHDHIVGTRGARSFNMNPARVNDQLASVFIQDEMSMFDDKLKFSLGSKLEHNDYSGFEGQPSAHLVWAPVNNQRIWGGVSRSVRTPSRIEKGIDYLGWIVPAQSRLNPTDFPYVSKWQGNPSFAAENVITYEIGYRTSVIKNLSFDISGFYSKYRGLNSYLPLGANLGPDSSYIIENLLMTNREQAHSYGLEVASVWQMLKWWRWDMNHSWYHDQHASKINYASSPHHRSSIRGLINVTSNLDFDVWWRYVGQANADSAFGYISIPSYFAMDLRTAWRPSKNLELSVTGQNLLQNKHLEYVSDSVFLPAAIVRGVYGKISLTF
jgi:iron complex outermembrane receptor protein